MSIDARTERFEMVELFGKPALFTNSRIDRATVPENLYCYDIRGSDNDPGELSTVEPEVRVNHAGAVITAAPVDFKGMDHRAIRDKINFLGNASTLTEYLAELRINPVEQSVTPPAARSKSETYIDMLNEKILPHIDYDELHKSYFTQGKEYAKGVLNALHEIMVEVYGGDTLTATYEDDDNDFAVIPGVIQGMNTGRVCLALLDIDLSSSGEHCGTDFICGCGVIRQGDREVRKDVQDFVSKWYMPYNYAYTAVIPDDIHVNIQKLPAGIKEMLADFRNHSAGFSAAAETDNEPEYGDDD